MTTLIICLLIILGLILVLAEILLIPGVGFAGIGGAVLILVGSILCYINFGATLGILVFGGSIIIGLGLTFYFLRSKKWKHTTLEASVGGKVETNVNKVSVGDTGYAVSRLNPVGKARFGDEIVEANCPGSFVDENTKLEVVKLQLSSVVVKPIK